MARKGFFDDKCSCCLQHGTLKNMWDENCEGEEIYGEMMNKCFAISWQKQEVEMEKICESCIKRLRDAVNFKKMVLASEELLLEYEDINEVSDTEVTNEQPEESEMVLIDLETDEMEVDIYMEEEYLDENVPTSPSKQTENAATMCKKDIVTHSVPVVRLERCDTVIRNKTEGRSENKPKENLGKCYEVSSDSDALSDGDENESIRSERKKLQDNLRAIIRCSNATPLKLLTDGYGCVFCIIAFREPSNLKQHILAKHGHKMKFNYTENAKTIENLIKMDITNLYCRYCNANMDTIESLLEHLETVHSEKVHRDVRFIIQFKFQNSDLKCCHCDKKFQTFKLLAPHTANHYRNYQCKTCKKWFVTRMRLRKHKQCHCNTGVSKYPKLFHNTYRRIKQGDTVTRSKKTDGRSENKPKENLGKRHEVSSDSDALSVGDENESIRSERKKLQDNLRAILRCSNATPLKVSTNTRGYGCVFCIQVFHEPRILKQHILANHVVNMKPKYAKTITNLVKMDITDLRCRYCKENIYTIESLLEHLKNVHSEKVHTDVRFFIPFKFQNSDLKCCHCDKKCQTFKLLASHTALHYRNYQCKTCKKWFVTRMRLRAHKQHHRNKYQQLFHNTNRRIKQGDTVIRSKTEGCSENKPKENLGKSREVRSDGDALLDDEENKSIRSEERMKLLDNLRAILLGSNATPLKFPTDRGYGCEFCILAFREPSILKQHILAEHGGNINSKYMMDVEIKTPFIKIDITDLHCRYCNENIDTIESLLEHLKTVHSEKVHTDVRFFIPFKLQNSDLKCCLCDKKFLSFQVLSKHTVTHFHNYQCEICKLWFIYRKSLITHRRHFRYTGVYPCSKCPKLFHTTKRRAKHALTDHSQRYRKLRCEICSELFVNSLERLERHMTLVHGDGPQSLFCNVCQQAFADTATLIAHLRTIHLNMSHYKCDYCGTEFKRKQQLRNHIRGHKNQPFVCPLCKRTFDFETHFNAHMREEHHVHECITMNVLNVPM